MKKPGAMAGFFVACFYHLPLLPVAEGKQHGCKNKKARPKTSFLTAGHRSDRGSYQTVMPLMAADRRDL